MVSLREPAKVRDTRRRFSALSSGTRISYLCSARVTDLLSPRQPTADRYVSMVNRLPISLNLLSFHVGIFLQSFDLPLPSKELAR